MNISQLTNDLQANRGLTQMKETTYTVALENLKKELTLQTLGNGTFRLKVKLVSRESKVSTQKIYKDLKLNALHWGGN